MSRRESVNRPIATIAQGSDRRSFVERAKKRGCNTLEWGEIVKSLNRRRAFRFVDRFVVSFLFSFFFPPEARARVFNALVLYSTMRTAPMQASGNLHNQTTSGCFSILANNEIALPFINKFYVNFLNHCLRFNSGFFVGDLKSTDKLFRE